MIQPNSVCSPDAFRSDPVASDWMLDVGGKLELSGLEFFWVFVAGWSLIGWSYFPADTTQNEAYAGN